jgi:hypothetical protein
MKLNYLTITDTKNPIHTITNKKGQTISLYKHPYLVDDMLLLAVEHSTKSFGYCDYFDYEEGAKVPEFKNGKRSN